MVCQNNRALFEQLTHLSDRGRLPGAILLTGPKPALKERFAIMLAAYSFCQSEKKPCLSCPSCQKILQKAHTEVLHFSGKGRANSFSVDTIREIKAQCLSKPLEADHRFFLLTDVEQLSIPAQNALLKLLEEPPLDTIFILTALSRQTVLPTILSRVTVYTLREPEPDFVQRLLEEICPTVSPDIRQKAGEFFGQDLLAAQHFCENEKWQKACQVGWEYIKNGKLFSPIALLTLLSSYEKDRETIQALLSFWQVQLARHTRQWSLNQAFPSPYSPARCAAFYLLLQEVQALLEQNGNLSLLEAYLAAHAQQILNRSTEP